MSFRKRNADVSPRSHLEKSQSPNADFKEPSAKVPGIRPSLVTGQPTISTGTPSLDSQLAGHAGLALGTSLLIEENGNTDYAGVLLKYFAAEGVVQDQVVHVVGFDEQWGRSLPGLASDKKDRDDDAKQEGDKMKIAWRYERLGDFSDRTRIHLKNERSLEGQASTTSVSSDVFCHTFDLAKKLAVPELARMRYYNTLPNRAKPPFLEVTRAISTDLKSTASQGSIHRIVIPSLLSPALYPHTACEPQNLIQFAHMLRGLLRQYSNRVSCMISIPLDLYPRDTGLIRWLEILGDGVLELAPFAHGSDEAAQLSTSGAATAREEPPQGLVKIHKLPVFHERSAGGGGLKGLGDDLAFTLTRRRFTIQPFHLPPAEGDTDSQQASSARTDSAKLSKEQIDF